MPIPKPDPKYLWELISVYCRDGNSINLKDLWIAEKERERIMSEYDQGVQELAYHIEKFFADSIGTIPEKELAIVAAADYVRRYCVPGAHYSGTFANEVILHAASLFASTDA